MITGNPVHITLYCNACGRGQSVPVRDAVSEELQPCRACGGVKFHSADQPNGDHPYELNHNDVRFLKSLRISQQD